MNLERRFRNGLGFGVAYTLLEAARQRLRQAQPALQRLRRPASGACPTTTAPTSSTCTTSTSCRSGASRTRSLKKLLGGWQVSGVTYLPVRAAADDLALGRRRGRGGHDGAAVEPRRGPVGRRPAVLERPGGRPELLVQPGGLRASGRRARSATPAATRTACARRASRAGTSHSSRTSRSAARKRLQLRLEAFNFINHPVLGNPTQTASTSGGPRPRWAASTWTRTAPTSDACSPRRASATSSWERSSASDGPRVSPGGGAPPSRAS